MCGKPKDDAKTVLARRLTTKQNSLLVILPLMEM